MCVASILLLQSLLTLRSQGRGDGGVCTAAQIADCGTDSSPATAARNVESLSPLSTALRDTAAANSSSSGAISSSLQQPGAVARSLSLGTQGAAARAASLQRSSDDVNSDVDSDDSDVSSDSPDDATDGTTETGSYSGVATTPSAASAAATAAATAAASSPSGWQGRVDADSGGVIGASGSNSAPQSPRDRGGLAPDLSLLPLMRAKVSMHAMLLLLYLL
jgi:hypothetical protein